MIWTIRILALLLLGMVARTGWADTRVRAGEHASFTRLVFYAPSDVDAWTAASVSDGFMIDIAPAPRDLDISEVFAFIPRTRIRDVALREGKIWINSDCDCHVSVFRARRDVIAIDIRDGQDPERPVTVPQTAGKGPQQISPFLLDQREHDVGTKWQIQPRIAFVPPPENTGQLINSAELATAVARAASAGVLSANNAGYGLDGPGIETRSALDSAKSDRAARLQTELCGNLTELDELPVISVMDAWRLIEDGASGARPVERAMAYLSLGFGAEAAVDFMASALAPDKAILLAQVAQFVDAPERVAPRSIRSAHSCGGVSALLAVLAAPPSENVAEPLGVEAVNVLSRLPFPLRAHLAPHLERRLLAANLAELAQSASFASLRASGEEDAARRGESRTPGGANLAGPVGQPALPPTAFFEGRTSKPIYDAIAAARFAAEDRILIEAWVKEAPSPSEADAASTFFVAALNSASRPLEALTHLDSRFGRRGVVSPGLENAISDTLDTATNVLGPGELLVLGARLSERPWYDRLPSSTRAQFEASVEAVRRSVTGSSGLSQTTAFEQHADQTVGSDPDQQIDPFAARNAAEPATASPRRVAVDAAILSAVDSLSRSARLRADAAERTTELSRAAQQ